MPCVSDYMEDNVPRRELDKVTAYLCTLCRMTYATHHHVWPEGLLDWFKAHIEFDNRREGAGATPFKCPKLT